MSSDDIVLRFSALLPSCHPQSVFMDYDEFYDELFKFFKRYARFPNPGAEIKCISRSLEYFLPQIHNHDNADLYLHFIFSIMEIFRSTNRNLIRNLLKEYLVRILKSHDCIQEKLKPPSLLESFPGRDIYYEVIPGCKRKVCVDSFFFEKFIFMNAFSFKRLLRYGVRFHVDDEHLRCYQDEFLMCILQQTGLRRKPYTYSKDEEGELRVLMNDHYPRYADRRRLYFVMLAMDLVVEKKIRKTEYHKDLIKSLKLLFKTIEDPLITVAEMTRLLHIVLKDEKNENRIRDFCNVFLKIFQRSAEPFQPRRLQHLSRCKVRQSLAQSQNLPHGVWSLRLPGVLKNYILLQKRNGEFHECLVKKLPPRKRNVFYSPEVLREKRYLYSSIVKGLRKRALCTSRK